MTTTTTKATTMPASLLEPLLPAPYAEVRLSEDAGGYYCAHLLFLAQQLARDPATRGALAVNDDGEPLVGFLHVPRDTACTVERCAIPDVVRHARTRPVVAAALRGYVEALLARDVRGPLRLLVTGFGPFRDVVSNPTGELVSRSENLRVILGQAFGADVEVDGDAVKRVEGARTKLWCLRAKARVSVADGERDVELEVGSACLPVDDDAIDLAREDSLQGLLARFQPHALLSLGAGKEGAYRVEVRPDSRGLRLDGPRPMHDGDQPATVVLTPSYALARAIHRGGAALPPRW